MRVTTSITLDMETAIRLDKEGNKSKLLNDLLKEYFAKVDLEAASQVGN
jgi:hypothetical protein